MPVKEKTMKSHSIIRGIAVLSLALTAAPLAAGAATTAPSSHVTHATAHVVKVTKVKFTAKYSGTIALLWSDSGVQASAVRGKGSATLLGAKSLLAGSGKGTASSTCNPFSGTGSLTGMGSVLKLSIVTSSATRACAADQSAPTSVTVKGVAKVLSGTGKYKGVSGTLAFSGSFYILSTTAGSNESDNFTATMTGTLTIKK
jgi:hypothetical protein